MDSNLLRFLKLHKEDIVSENYDKLFEDFKNFYFNTKGYFITPQNSYRSNLLNILLNVISLEELLSKMSIIPFGMFQYYYGPRVDLPKNIKEIKRYAFKDYYGIVSYYKNITETWVDAWSGFKGTLEEKDG